MEAKIVSYLQSKWPLLKGCYYPIGKGDDIATIPASVKVVWGKKESFEFSSGQYYLTVEQDRHRVSCQRGGNYQTHW